jgi:hypothetical protein
MNENVVLVIREDYPLEIATALLVVAQRTQLGKWRIRVTADSYSVLKEVAYFALLDLASAGSMEIHPSPGFPEGLCLLGGSATCVVHCDQRGSFDMCIDFLRATGESTECLVEAKRCYDARQAAIENVTAKAAIVIGTGPSLVNVDLRQYADALSFGCNKLYLLPYAFRPTHYVFEDRVVTEDVFRSQPDFGASLLWLPQDLAHLCTDSMFYCLDQVVPHFPQFSTSHALASSGWTVTFVMLQIAYWMGVSEVFLVGVDGTYAEPIHCGNGLVRTSKGVDVNHFTPEYYGAGSRYHKPVPARVQAAYECANASYTNGNRRILNCSTGTKVEAFPLGALPPPEYFHGS